MVLAPHGVVFDLDGTLIDSGEDIVRAANHALEANGKHPLPSATLLRFVGDGARSLCARATGLGERHPDVDRVLSSYLEYYADHPTDHTRWMPHAREVLDELSSYHLALCTNKPRKVTDLVLARLGVRTLFAAIVAGGDVAFGKPSSQPILEIARQLRVDPGELVVVGDGPQDIEAGRRAGARAVGVRGGFLPLERLIGSQPDVLLDSLAEVPWVVRRWGDATTKSK
jgi:phosphoglycolate phosphatase